MGAAARAGVSVEFKATGVESVRNGLRLVRTESENVGRSAEGMGHGAARSIGEFTRGIGNLAASGKVTSLSMRELSGSLFGLTSFLGPGGMLLPVLATVGLAIYEVFSKTRDEIEKTRRQAQEELAALERSADLRGLGGLAQRYYSGDKYAVQAENESDVAFRARQLGQKNMELEISQKRQQIAINDESIASMRKLVVQQTRDNNPAAAETAKSLQLLTQRNHEYQSSIDLLLPFLAKYTQRAADAKKGFDTFAKDEGERTKNMVAEEQRKFVEDFAKKELPGGVDNQFVNHLFGVLLPMPKVQRIGELTTQTLIDAMNVSAQKGIAGLQPAKLPTDTFAEKFLANIDSMAERIRGAIADSIGNAISSGFDAAFQKGANAGNVFAAIAKSILSSMGEMFEDIGRNALIGLISMAKIKAALLEFMPEIGIPLAIGLIAFGALLKGSAGGGGSYGGGGGGGGSSYSGSLPPIVSTGVVTAASGSASAASRLAPMAPQQNIYYVIGEDPKAWRQVQERLNANAKRG